MTAYHETFRMFYHDSESFSGYYAKLSIVATIFLDIILREQRPKKILEQVSDLILACAS